MSLRSRGIGVLLFALAVMGNAAAVQMEFIHAIENGRIAEVQALLTRGFNVNEAQAYGFSEGDSPLMVAAGQGNAQMVALLLRHGARVNYRSPRDQETALFRAVKMAGNKGITDRYTIDFPTALALLLKAGANPDLPDHNGQLPLYFARHAWTIKALLDGGANPNARTDRPPLLEHAGNAERLTLLLKAGADPNVRDVQGQSALDVAAGQGDVAAVRALLAAMRPDAIRARDKEGRTALHSAAWSGHPEIVTLLLTHGLPPTTAALAVSVERGHLQAARLQRQALGDPPWPQPASQASAELRVYTLILQEQPAAALAAYQAFEREACGGRTPLMAAVDAGNVEAVRALLALGVDVNYQTPAPVRTRQLPPHPMSSSGHPRTVHELPPPCDASSVGAAASSGWVGSRSGPALLSAVQRDDLAVARLLLAAGADPALKDNVPPHVSAREWWTPARRVTPSPEWKTLLKIE